jgi:hypothetical protein
LSEPGVLTHTQSKGLVWVVGTHFADAQRGLML